MFDIKIYQQNISPAVQPMTIPSPMCATCAITRETNCAVANTAIFNATQNAPNPQLRGLKSRIGYAGSAQVPNSDPNAESDAVYLMMKKVTKYFHSLIFIYCLKFYSVFVLFIVYFLQNLNSISQIALFNKVSRTSTNS